MLMTLMPGSAPAQERSALGEGEGALPKLAARKSAQIRRQLEQVVGQLAEEEQEKILPVLFKNPLYKAKGGGRRKRAIEAEPRLMNDGEGIAYLSNLCHVCCEEREA
jgi:hypothetical protein